MVSNLLEAASMKLVFVLIILAIGFSTQASAQGWHGLEPIRSTCKDVEGVLRVSACGNKSVQSVVDAYTVTIVFSKDECHEKWPYETYGVPPGTVTDIVLIPRHPNRVGLSDLAIDASSFHVNAVPDDLDVLEYSSRELGLRFTASKDGEILDIRYFPASTYDYLRCSLQSSDSFKSDASSGRSSILIGAYDPQALRTSGKLFADLVSKFNLAVKREASQKSLAQICIVSYAGRRPRLDAAKRSAMLARQYLISHYSIDMARIVEIDGGFVEEARVELFLRPPGARLPTPHPTIHPKNVVIID